MDSWLRGGGIDVKKCCKENGVPGNCLGLCMKKESSSKTIAEVKIANACSEFENNIKECYVKQLNDRGKRI